MIPSPLILLVDDSPEDLAVYRRFLTQESPNTFSFLETESAEEGLALARSHQPNCILLDFNLPEMTGIEFLERLPTREGKPSIPVVMLTGQGTETVAANSIKNGAEEYLAKNSLTAERLALTVMGTLKNAAMAQSIREHLAHLNISKTLHAASSISESASTLIQEIGTGMDWQFSAIWILESDSPTFRCGGIWQDSAGHYNELVQMTQDLRLSPGEDLSGQAWSSGEVVHHQDFSLAPQGPRLHIAQTLGLSGAIAIPLYCHDQIAVVLEGWYAHQRQATKEQFAMLSAIGQQFSKFLERQHMEQVLRQRELEYRLVTDHIPALIASYDEHRRYRLANKSYQEWFHQTEETIIGHHAQEVLGQHLYAQVCPYMDQVLNGQVVNFELRAKNAAGINCWLQATYVPDFDEDQRIKGFFSLVSDISQGKITENRLRNQTEELARSNGELEQFAHIASHDLQEPLRKVQAFSDRLRTRAANLLGPQELEYLDRMHNATNRMQTLIQDLLAFSRVGTKPQPLQNVNLENIVAEVLIDLETLTTRVGASIQCDQLPIIEGDPTQIRQLFQNLIGNALKFHKIDSPPHVRIFCEEQPPMANPSTDTIPVCRIGVQDNGIGFEQQYANRIFGVFQRLHGRDEYEGTGIGLSICKKVVERHGGTITVTSSLGMGTTFHIELPVRQTGNSGKKSKSFSSTPEEESLDHHPTGLFVGIDD